MWKYSGKPLTTERQRNVTEGEKRCQKRKYEGCQTPETNIHVGATLPSFPEGSHKILSFCTSARLSEAVVGYNGCGQRTYPEEVQRSVLYTDFNIPTSLSQVF